MKKRKKEEEKKEPELSKIETPGIKDNHATNTVLDKAKYLVK